MTENIEKRDPKERDEKGQLVPGHEIRKTSGAWLYLKSGRVPSVRGRRRISRELSTLRQKLMEAVPDSQDVRRQVLINQIVSSQGFILLLESFLKRFGILDPKSFQKGQVQTQGSMAMIISLLNVQARAVAALGMDSKALDEIKAPYEIVQEQERAEKSNGHNPSSA